MTDRELMQQALEAMGAVGADAICEASHHAKKDQHKWGEPCPLQQRWHIAYQALRERLAHPVQEPVAWRWKERINGDFDSWVISASEPPPYAIKQQPLYTITPQRQWQGLARLELQKAVEGLEDLEDCWIAIESALREKNT